MPAWLDYLKMHRAEGHDLLPHWGAHLGTATGTGPP
jgi:hypothetical protein